MVAVREVSAAMRRVGVHAAMRRVSVHAARPAAATIAPCARRTNRVSRALEVGALVVMPLVVVGRVAHTAPDQQHKPLEDGDKQGNATGSLLGGGGG